MELCVLGAGMAGLTTALELQKEFPNANITIVADKFGLDCTYEVTDGVFRPTNDIYAPNDELKHQWISDSYTYWNDILCTSEASLAGITQVSAYIFSASTQDFFRNRDFENILPIYREVTEGELDLCPGNWKYGSFLTTSLTESKIYQPWAMNKFQKYGGKIQTQFIKRFSELEGIYDIIINCTGLGAKKLCDDHKLISVRTQVIKIKAPWLKTAFYSDNSTYVLPGFDGTVTLGERKQFDSFNLSVSDYDTNSIWDQCTKLLPSLVNAPMTKEAVEIRPHRNPIRVEYESIKTLDGKSIHIVHNYGHGNSKVTTVPGTAKYAVKLVKDIIFSSGSKFQ